ncbi:hypothetical protein GBA52_016847 [Prunus armeniaca]|nr:hypothetical protein GBA52_016847 [Prunus armeniaca]
MSRFVATARCKNKNYFLEFSNHSLNVEVNTIYLHNHCPLPLHHHDGNLGIRLYHHPGETLLLTSKHNCPYSIHLCHESRPITHISLTSRFHHPAYKVLNHPAKTSPHYLRIPSTITISFDHSVLGFVSGSAQPYTDREVSAAHSQREPEEELPYDIPPLVPPSVQPQLRDWTHFLGKWPQYGISRFATCQNL